MKLQLNNFNNRHLGETIYIIGCAPTLNRLTDEDIDFLNKSITIGVNFSHLKVDLKYWVGGHIEQAVFALESDLSHSVPLFAHCDEKLKYVTQVWENKRVVPVNATNPRLPLNKDFDQTGELRGATSIILSATHLAYIMGAQRIVYLGFEGKNALHFYTENDKIKKDTVRKIKQIMLSGKYWSENNYNISFPFWNVHRAFELMLDENVPNGHFGDKKSLEKRPLNYFEKNGKNRQDIKEYVSFLNKNNVKTCTLKSEEMVVDAGCSIIDNIRGGQ